MSSKLENRSITEINQYLADVAGEQEIYIKESGTALPVLYVKNKFSCASICLQGAHLLSWVPAGGNDVIWMSSQARPQPAKSLRGGIPVCWPWFGAHEKNADYPAHGFARTVMWQLQNVNVLAEGKTQITLKLDMQAMDEHIQTMWPYDCELEYIITLSETLKLELMTKNKSSENIQITQALHSYFNIGDIVKTQLHGLDGLEYLDKPDGFKRKKQQGVVSISEEVDRIYLQTQDDILITAPNKNIRLAAQGSRSTVVWNPWQEMAEKMADLGENGYLKMLCVETANAADDIVSIPAGEQHVLQVEYFLADNV